MLATGTLAAGGDGPSALFIRANGLYGDGKYAEAATAYEQILAQGIESGAVQYNLGNAYLKAGDVGRAVLAYERARRLIPGDPDLAANLGFARESARDVPETSLPGAHRVPAGGAPLDRDARHRGRDRVVDRLARARARRDRAGRARGEPRGGDRGRARVRTAHVVRGLAVVDARTSRDRGRGRAGRRDRPLGAEPDRHRALRRDARHGAAVERTRENASLVTSRDGRRGWLQSDALAAL
jgi:tetratricopeptide (TPR) repeat protein